MSTRKLRPVTAVICDDVRIEDNGKEILIGCYTGDISVPEPYTQLQLALSLVFQVLEPGQTRITLEVRGPGAGQKVGFTASFDTVEKTRANEVTFLSAGGLPVQIKESGSLEIAIKEDDSDWQTIRSIRVNIARPHEQRPTEPNPSPSASEQPS